MKRSLNALMLALGLLCAASGFAQTAAASNPASAPAAKASAAAAPAKPATKSDTKSVAPDGGPGKVWVNKDTKRYHCEGTKFYGKTKNGEYLSEVEAKAQGNKGKSCGK